MTLLHPSSDDQPLDGAENALTKCRPLQEKELHIAPMLNVSKREFRKLFSILSTKVVLWTDMVVDDTIAYSEKLEDVLEGDVLPNLQICQIGGNCPDLCGNAARVVQEHGYMEVNLNIDCPSERVSLKREFGAILMKKVETAYTVLEAMEKNTTSIPISVKCRIGVDEWDDLPFVISYIRRLHPVCRRFYLHARKCVLNGLMNAKQNRSIPPLNFPRVYDVCREFPDCQFWINGGIRTLDHAKAICFGPQHTLDGVHQVPCVSCGHENGSCTAPACQIPPNLIGCMMGRAAMENPAIFADADRYFYGLERNPCRNRRQVFEAYCSYLEEMYPRRCCDDDPRCTNNLPVPEIKLGSTDYCPICRPVYLGETAADTTNERSEQVEEPKQPTREQSMIAPRVLGRALQPIRGLFYGLPKSKFFNLTLDQLAKDRVVRNCGPGYMIRKALDVIPEGLLDQDFSTTEEFGVQRFH